MATEEQLKEWQEQQDALKEQLKAQIDRSLVTNVEYHFEELDNGDGTMTIVKSDRWAMTIRGLWQNRPTPKDSA
jgi:hypothetical protein